MSAQLQDLPRRLLALEETAYLEFARTFRGRFFRYFLEHGVPEFEAEDMAASLVTDVLLKSDRYQPREGVPFSAWVYQLMRNAAIDWRRSQKTRFLSVETLADIVEQPSAPDVPAIAAVREALEDLVEDDRLIVEMRNVDGECPFAEIGRLLGISAGAARVRHHRALRKLELALTKDQRIHLRLPGRGATEVS